jgi:hypothetical protein
MVAGTTNAVMGRRLYTPVSIETMGIMGTDAWSQVYDLRWIQRHLAELGFGVWDTRYTIVQYLLLLGSCLVQYDMGLEEY